jgi:hypothetical protein
MTEADSILTALEGQRGDILGAIREMAAIRQEARRLDETWTTAIRLAHKLGVSNVEIAEAAGLHPVRVSQIINRP